jgi:hypothetical protein
MPSLTSRLVRRFVSTAHCTPLASSPPPPRRSNCLSVNAASHNATPLTVLEIFQSEGCRHGQSISAAIDTLLPELRGEALLLTYHVKHWERFGWHDTFGLSQSDDRRRDYFHHLKGSDDRVSTPQVIVNGLTYSVGGSSQELDRIVAKGVDEAKALEPISLKVVDSGSAVIINALVTQEYEILTVTLVIYDPQPGEIEIKIGNDVGPRVLHQNVVQSITKIGLCGGGVQRFEIPERSVTTGLSAVILVQSGRGGPIVAAVLL